MMEFLAESTFWLSLSAAAGLGLAVGLRHALEPDHLVAMATMVTQERSPRSAIRLGASWGLGHACVLFAVAGALAVAQRSMPAAAGNALELLVAMMVIAVGARTLYLGWTMGRGGPDRWHSHGSAAHQHAMEGQHLHVGPLRLARGPLLVGMVHGLAGSGALAALAVATLPSAPSRIVFMLLFGLGTTLGMAAVTGLAGRPLAHLVSRPAAGAALSVVSGAAAVLFGVAYSEPLMVALFLN